MTQSEEIYTRRQIAMQSISEMDKNAFLWYLLSKTLPIFDLAKEDDPDYIEDYNSILSIDVAEKLFANREKLRQTEINEYIYSYGNSEQIRELSMELIMQKPIEEFIDSLRKCSVPIFVRANPEDQDYVNLYRSPNVSSPEMYALMYRNQLRQMEYAEFISAMKTFEPRRN